MFKFKVLIISILVVCFYSGAQQLIAGELVWEKTMLSAFYKAMSEKKKIILFVGRDNCGKCKYMREKVFESEKPAVKELLEKKYVLWFSDADRSTEWNRVANGLREIPLPLICIIDPASGKLYEDRTTGIQHSPVFYSRLLKDSNK